MASTAPCRRARTSSRRCERRPQAPPEGTTPRTTPWLSATANCWSKTGPEITQARSRLQSWPHVLIFILKFPLIFCRGVTMRCIESRGLTAMHSPSGAHTKCMRSACNHTRPLRTPLQKSHAAAGLRASACQHVLVDPLPADRVAVGEPVRADVVGRVVPEPALGVLPDGVVGRLVLRRALAVPCGRRGRDSAALSEI